MEVGRGCLPACFPRYGIDLFYYSAGMVTGSSQWRCAQPWFLRSVLMFSINLTLSCLLFSFFLFFGRDEHWRSEARHARGVSVVVHDKVPESSSSAWWSATVQDWAVRSYCFRWCPCTTGMDIPSKKLRDQVEWHYTWCPSFLPRSPCRLMWFPLYYGTSKFATLRQGLSYSLSFRKIKYPVV